MLSILHNVLYIYALVVIKNYVETSVFVDACLSVATACCVV